MRTARLHQARSERRLACVRVSHALLGAGFLGAVLLWTTACSSGGDSSGTGTPEAAPAWAYERVFPAKEHPATLAIRLDSVDVSLADRIVMEQELKVEAGFEAEFPEYLPEDFEGFTVVAIEWPGGAENQARTKRLILEPDRSGELAIAPLAVYFHRGGEAKESHFLTEEIQVAVKGVDDIGSLATRPGRGIFAAPVEESSGHPALWVGIAAAAAVVVFLLVSRKTRPKQAPPPTPPHELAYDALRRLVALDLIAKGEIETFFVHLSSILRDYIERRFHVHAPERTTEEFLEEASRHPALERHRTRLAEFLTLSDRVKFARFEPEEADIQGTFDVLKQFIEETREETVTPA